MKKSTNLLLASVLSVSLVGCASDDFLGGVCAGENAPLCLFGAVVLGGIAIAALAGGGSAVLIHHAIVSDERLKTDIRHYKTLDNGLKAYAYRYRGDNRQFVGVLAQDVLKDKRYADAVNQGSDGFYRVDYAKLGLKLFNSEALILAGEAAAKRSN